MLKQGGKKKWALLKQHNQFIEIPKVFVVCLGQKATNKFPVIWLTKPFLTGQCHKAGRAFSHREVGLLPRPGYIASRRRVKG